MNVWRSLAQFPQRVAAPIFSIGNFDGFHLGHQRTLEAVCRRAEEAGGTPLVLTFDPHPTRVVAPERAPRLLTPLATKIEVLKKAGVAGVLVLPFTEALSRLTPEEFTRTVLCERLRAREVIVGGSFRFGHGQAGDVRTLRELGRTLGFVVDEIAPVRVRGEVVSSTRIRQLLAEGRVSLANRLLGRCFSVRGLITGGMRIGRSRTVPTLNLERYEELLPGRGVYVTETVCDGVRATSVTNVGHGPTFQARELRVESFLLEGPPPPGARRMEVIFWRRLRDERRFPSAEALRAQILRDAGAARAFFRRLRKWRLTLV